MAFHVDPAELAALLAGALFAGACSSGADVTAEPGASAPPAARAETSANTSADAAPARSAEHPVKPTRVTTAAPVGSLTSLRDAGHGCGAGSCS